MIDLEIYDKIYNVLKSFLTENSQYQPIVTKEEHRQWDKFPLVVITEENNAYNLATTRFEETRSRANYEVNIFTTDIVKNNVKISKHEIAKELKYLVENVMGYNLRMKRTSCRPTPNMDDNILRVTMRYSAKINDNTGKLY